MKYQVGDWVRFMNNGRLVIDEIAYIVPRSSWDKTPQAVTTQHGTVDFEYIQEMRRQRETLQ